MISQVNPTDFDYSKLSDAQTQTYKGKAEITISNYDNDSAPDVKVGSVFENNGTLFIVDSADITPTGYSGISNSTTFYLYYDESAGTFIYSSTAPTWSDSKQGWYNGNDRAFFSMYKDSGGTLYQHKNIITNDKIRIKRYSLGSWNMDTLDNIHKDLDELGLSAFSDIITANVIIYGDLSNTAYPFINKTQSNCLDGGGITSGPSIIILRRVESGMFDSTEFNDTTMNRGYLTIQYQGTSA